MCEKSLLKDSWQFPVYPSICVCFFFKKNSYLAVLSLHCSMQDFIWGMQTLDVGSSSMIRDRISAACVGSMAS